MVIDRPDQVESNSHSGKTIFVVLIAGLGLASMFLCLFVLSRSLTYRVTAQLIVPADRAKACIELIESDSSGASYQEVEVSFAGSPSVAVIQVVRKAKDGQAVQIELDALSSRLIERVGSSITTQPAADERFVQLEGKLRELEQTIRTLNTNGDENAVDIQALAGVWREQIATGQSLASQLKALDAKLSAAPAGETQVMISDSAVSEAEGRDQKLQADAQALQQRETRLKQVLSDLLAEGGLLLERHAAAIHTADKLVAEHVEEEQANDLAASLAAIRKELAELLKAGTELADVWVKQHAALSTSEGDAVQAQRELESAAKGFQQNANASKLALNKTVESIGEGSDQPTKRLVLRNTLSQQLEEGLEAHEAANSVAGSVLLLNNRELAALVETVAGLRSKVHEQKERIVAALHQEESTRVRSEYQRALAAAQAERTKVGKHAAELDDAILQTGNQLLEAVQKDQSQRHALAQTGDLHQQRAEVLSQLRKLATEQQRTAMTSAPTVTPFFVPAQAVPLLPKQPEILRAMLIGASPLGAGLLLWALIALVSTLRRSRQERAEYAEIMQSATSRPSKKR